MSASVVRVACVQVNARDDMDANIAAAGVLARQAAKAGAKLISFPEYVALMDGRGRVMLAGAREEEGHPALAAFRALARELAATLHVGSLTVLNPGGKPSNRGYVISPDGAVAARYDKIHMFDLTLPDGREVFESRVYQPGSQAVVARTDVGALGLSICYDLRFGALFRALARGGADIALVPASFLPANGVDHWQVMLRARAIETGAFVVASAQCGQHGGNRASYGHSTIVDPWGRVLAEAGDEPGLIMADIDLALSRKIRAENPWHSVPAPEAVELAEG